MNIRKPAAGSVILPAAEFLDPECAGRCWPIAAAACYACRHLIDELFDANPTDTAFARLDPCITMPPAFICHSANKALNRRTAFSVVRQFKVTS
jgi:hypothetical protein